MPDAARRSPARPHPGTERYEAWLQVTHNISPATRTRPRFLGCRTPPATASRATSRTREVEARDILPAGRLYERRQTPPRPQPQALQPLVQRGRPAQGQAHRVMVGPCRATWKSRPPGLRRYSAAGAVAAAPPVAVPACRRRSARSPDYRRRPPRSYSRREPFAAEAPLGDPTRVSGTGVAVPVCRAAAEFPREEAAARSAGAPLRVNGLVEPAGRSPAAASKQTQRSTTGTGRRPQQNVLELATSAQAAGPRRAAWHSASARAAAWRRAPAPRRAPPPKRPRARGFVAGRPRRRPRAPRFAARGRV